jgi:uracil-DNA glycosylase
MLNLTIVREQIISCEKCPRLREYCERIGREKRRAFRDETYWAKPVPGFGDPNARMLLIGLAQAHTRESTGRVYRRRDGSSGDFLMAALHRAVLEHHDVSIQRWFEVADVHRCGRSLRATGQQTHPGRIARCLPQSRG